jgi:hypothetical protein
LLTLTTKSKKKGHDTDSDNDSTMDTNKAKGQSQWVQSIEKDNRCDKHHGHACFVRNDGSHYHLTIADKSLWGMMMVWIANSPLV